VKNTIIGKVIEYGTDHDTGIVRAVVETTKEEIDALDLNPFGRRCYIVIEVDNGEIK